MNTEIKYEIENVISKIENGVNVADILTSKFFKPEMRQALSIIDKWTFNYAYVDERSIPELLNLIGR